MASENQIQLVISAVDSASQNIGKIAQNLDKVAIASNTVANLGNKISSAYAGITKISRDIFFVGNALNQLQSLVVSGPFDLLIGQNIRLQQTLLSTAASIASTQKVLANGLEITDPTAKIQALGPAVDAALQRIRQGSLELVGVTSADLTNVFQIVATQASSIGANLNDAADITLNLSAALGTLQIPLFQARQEITSIVQGTIDQNSVLAKTLGITNAQANLWKSQGKFVEELNKRLETFRAGNKLAAESVDGITSNIKEIVQNIGLAAGGDFIKPIVSGLNQVYQFLKANQTAISEFVTTVAKGLFDAFQNIGKSIKSLFGNSQTAIVEGLKLGFTLASTAINLFATNLQIASTILGPFLQLLGSGLKFLNDFIQQLRTDPVTQWGLAITGVTIALNAGLIPAIIRFISINFAGAILTAGRALIGLGIAAGTTSPAISGAIASLTSLQAAMTAGTVTTGTLTAALSGLGAVAATVLLPLAAIAAGLATIQLIRYTKDLKESTEATEELRRQSDAIADSTIALAQKLAAARDRQAIAQANGVKLSDEEIAKNKQLQFEARRRTELIDEQIKAVEKLKAQATGDENKGNLQSQIDLLNRLKNNLGGFQDVVKTVQQALPRLGGASEKLSADLKNALEALNNPGGQSDIFTKKTEEVLNLSIELQKLNAISVDSAVSNLQKIASSDVVDPSLRQKASDAIASIYQSEAKKKVDANELAQSQIQASIAKGNTTEIDGIRETTKLKIESLQQQEKAVLESAARQDAIRRANFEIEEKEIIRRGQLAEQARAAASTPVEKANADNSIKAEQANLASARERFRNQQIEADRKVSIDSGKLKAQADLEASEGAVKLLEAQQTKALAIVKDSEVQRLTEIQRLRNQGLLSAEEQAQAEANLTQSRIGAELQAEKIKLAELEKLRASGVAGSEEKLQASRQKINQLTLDAVRNEAKAQEAAIATFTAKLQQSARLYQVEIDKENLKLSQQQSILDAIARSLDNRSKLLNANKDLAASQGELATTELDILAKGAKSDRDKKAIAQEIARTKLDSLLIQQRFEAESLKIEQAKLDITQKRKEIELAIKENQSKIELQKAQIEVQIAQKSLQSAPNDPEKQLKLLEAQGKVASAKVSLQGVDLEKGLLSQEKGLNAQINQRQLLALANRQRSQRLQAASELVEANPDAGQKVAQRRQLEQDIVNSRGQSVENLVSQSGQRSQDTLTQALTPQVGTGGNELVELPNLQKDANQLLQDIRDKIGGVNQDGEANTKSEVLLTPSQRDRLNGSNFDSLVVKDTSGRSQPTYVQTPDARQQLEALQGNVANLPQRSQARYAATNTNALYAELRGKVPGLSNVSLKLDVDRTSVEAAKRDLAKPLQGLNQQAQGDKNSSTQDRITIHAPISVSVASTNEQQTGKAIADNTATYLSQVLDAALNQAQGGNN